MSTERGPDFRVIKAHVTIADILTKYRIELRKKSYVQNASNNVTDARGKVRVDTARAAA